MRDTVTALFEDQAQAESAVRELQSAKFNTARTELRPHNARVPDFGSNAARGVGVGSIGGTVVGIILGVIAIGLLPGTHTFVQGGVIVPFMLAMSLGATGGLIGLLMSAAAAHERALEQELQSGRYAVSVDTEPHRLESARQILLSRGAMSASSIDSPVVKRGGRRALE